MILITVDLLIDEFHVCEFTCLLKFISNSQNQYLGYSPWAFLGMHRKMKNLSPLTHAPSRGWTGQFFAFLFKLSSHPLYKCRFCGSIPCQFLGVTLLFNKPKYSPEVWSNVPEHLKAVVCLLEKPVCYISFLQACVIVLLAEFNISESTIYFE